MTDINDQFVKLHISEKINEGTIVKANFPYNAMQPDDLTFKEDERFVVESLSPDKLWIIATREGTNERGYIPANFVSVANESLIDDYFIDCDRMEIEMRLLFAKECLPGTFTIRPSSGGELCLSIMGSKMTVKHFKIHISHKNKYFIKPNNKFPSLQSLINNYKNCCELGCHLKEPLKTCAPAICSRNLIIPYKEFSDHREIGEGYFGKVYYAKWKSSHVALKMIKPDKINNEEFIEEAKILHRLDHKNLIKMLGLTIHENNIILVMEYMKSGHLGGVLRKDKGKSINIRMLAHMASQIANGMHYIAQQELIHRDLRADNVLIDDSFVCKIADFGLARTADFNFHEIPDSKFPIKWTAIEATKRGNFSLSSDIWSYGVLLWELVTFGEEPYKGIKGNEVITWLFNGNRLVIPEDTPFPIPHDWYYEIMLKCWDHNPSNRPPFKSIFKFFNNWMKNSPTIYSL